MTAFRSVLQCWATSVYTLSLREAHQIKPVLQTSHWTLSGCRLICKFWILLQWRGLARWSWGYWWPQLKSIIHLADSDISNHPPLCWEWGWPITTTQWNLNTSIPSGRPQSSMHWLDSLEIWISLFCVQCKVWWTTCAVSQILILHNYRIICNKKRFITSVTYKDKYQLHRITAKLYNRQFWTWCRSIWISYGKFVKFIFLIFCFWLESKQERGE